MLWQGTPRWTVMARRAFHVRKVAFYFALLVVLRVASDLYAGANLSTIAGGSLWLIGLGAATVGALALLARATANAAVYTITNRRVAMRIGVALDMNINLPFSQIRSADLRRYDDGAGDISLLLHDSARQASYVLFWPHVRPWNFNPVRPMIRSICDAAHVAEILAGALQAHVDEAGDEASETFTVVRRDSTCVSEVSS